MERKTHGITEEMLARIEALLDGNETQHSTEHGARVWEHERLDRTVRDFGSRPAPGTAAAGDAD